MYNEHSCLVSRDHEHQSPLSFLSTAFESSMVPASRIIGFVNFFFFGGGGSIHVFLTLIVSVDRSGPPGSYVHVLKLLITRYCSDGSIHVKCGLHHCTVVAIFHFLCSQTVNGSLSFTALSTASEVATAPFVSLVHNS